MSESPPRFQVRRGKRKCEEAFEIKQIIGHRKRQRKQEFEVTWWGYDTTDWITAQNFCTTGAYDLLTKYRAEVMGVKWKPKKYPKFVIQDTEDANDDQESSHEKSATPEDVEEAQQAENSEAEEAEDVDNPEPAVPDEEEVHEENAESAEEEEEPKNSESDENEEAEAPESDAFASDPEDPVPNLSLDDILSPEEEAHLPPVKMEPPVADEDDDDFESGVPKSSESFDDFGYQEDWYHHVHVKSKFDM